MRIKRELLTSMLLVLFMVQQISAQKPAQQPATGTQSSNSEVTDSKEEQGRAQAVQEIRNLADRVLRFQNRELKIKTIILLADVLWDKGKDAAFARKLFLKADELIRQEVASARERNSTNSSQGEAPLSAPVARRLKRLLVQKLYRHDSILSESLSDQDKLSPENSVEQLTLSEKIFTAKELMKKNNYSSAARYIEKSIEDNPSGMRDLHGFLSLLSDLRIKDRLTSDKLFLMAISQMSTLRAVQTNDILIIGNYLFASGRLDPKFLTAPQVFISPAWVSGILLEADVSVARPGISATTARAYLSAATHMLVRTSDDADENLRKFAATRLLIPHAQVFAPELVPQLSAFQPSTRINTTAREGGDAAGSEKEGKPDLETLLQRIDRMPVGNARNLYVLQTFRTLFINADHNAASKVASKIEDQTARTQLLGLVKFRQAAKAIEAGQLEIAEQNLNGLDSAFQRGLLKLGLAQLFLKKGDRAGAEAALNSALTGLRATDSNPQPNLILAAVELLAALDLRVATQTFREAVQAFNALEASPTGQSPSKFSETVKVGDSSVTFPLEVVGVKSGTLSSTLKSLTGDPEAVKTTILDLKDESTLGESILAFASVRLG